MNTCLNIQKVDVLAITFKLIKKNAPQIKWILSYSDGCDCGDGTIYRASGFYLTNINDSITRANMSRKLIQEQCKKIQYIGIIAILIIFILLLMKHFDLFNLFDKKNI